MSGFENWDCVKEGHLWFYSTSGWHIERSANIFVPGFRFCRACHLEERSELTWIPQNLEELKKYGKSTMESALEAVASKPPTFSFNFNGRIIEECTLEVDPKTGVAAIVGKEVSPAPQKDLKGYKLGQ